MRSTILTAREIGGVIAKLLSEHQELHWAVAWGDDEKIWMPLMAQSLKFVNVVFGISFCGTDPGLVTAMIGKRNAFVIESMKGGTFHPKIYAFRSGDRAAAIVGSANFTPGGFGRNFEVSVLFEGQADHPTFKALFGIVAQAAELGTGVNHDFAANYRLRHNISSSMPRPSRDPPGLRQKSRHSTTAFIERGWKEHLDNIRSRDARYVRVRLSILRLARQFLMSTGSFGELASTQRKAISGVIGKVERERAGLNDDWGLFGSMQGMGDFANRVRLNDGHLAKAVDSIPLQGFVERAEYDRFRKHFLDAFSDTTRVGGIRTASRLLALKRPDVFLCVSNPNLIAASEDIGFARSTLDLDNYWDRVVEPIKASAWYNSPRPNSKEAGEIWDGRVAMLDALYYEPSG